MLRSPRTWKIALAAALWIGIAAVVVPALHQAPPESSVAAYLQATGGGDREAALSTWRPWDCCPPPELYARRAALTKELTDLGIGKDHRILFTEWWNACCMPTIVDGPEHAGRARIFVAAKDREQKEHELVFDVFLERPWRNVTRSEIGTEWILREVYRRGERSITGGSVGPLTEEAAIASAQSATGIGLQRDAPGVAPGSRFAVKRSTLGDLKRQLGADDFIVPADPARNVFIVAATGPAFRGEIIPASAVVVLDVNDHLVLGIDLRERSEIPAYFDRLP